MRIPECAATRREGAVMATLHEVIEAFRNKPTNSEKGTSFEELMVRYFQLDPTLSQQYDQVWRWPDWPDRWGADAGIDLVARERDTGNMTAVQCKFYGPDKELRKEDIDSFFTESGKKPFTNRVIISTTDRWSKHAEAALREQQIEVQRIGLADIAEAPIDWDVAWPDGDLHVELAPARKHDPRAHQQQAIDAVFTGFQTSDRGKLVMACGTGKTFTALKIAERTAAENGGRARILFCVPSISLLSQTLREWTGQTQLDMRAFAVCSDNRVSRAAEDIAVHDVSIPVTTDPARLAAEMAHRKRASGLTVVFATYQSIQVIADANLDPFDLIICDEAHRTTGVTLLDAKGEAKESAFVKIHDPNFIAATRRLYMTATPRLFDEKVKDKAVEVSAVLASMDDETIYGPEFHRLSFGDAVERGLLTDYKVVVLTVDQKVMSGPLQGELAREHGELKLDDASKIVGCWNALAKRGAQFPPGERPMRRAVAFAADIKSSKQVAAVFGDVVDAYRDLLAAHDDEHEDGQNRDLSIDARHVDGTMNALQRGRELAWLKQPIADDQCRILSNARCLSEGVDVPALDAVLFLHPRNSMVDVVQSVGRVMRLSNDKDYGYIILPVAVPEGMPPSQALADNKRFKVVWQVLNALRAHDDRFNATINSIALNAPDKPGQQGSTSLIGDHIGPVTDTANTETPTDTTTETLPQQYALFSLSAWQEAIYARIVDKVGSRKYWEDWAADVADIAGTQITRINAILDGADTTLARAFEVFLQGLRDNLNESISRGDAISMLSQHLITLPVFEALFAGHEFADHNPVSQVMSAMVARLHDSGLEAETAKLQGFYESVRVRASEVSSAEGKQKVIAELYERFFKLGFTKQSEALGIVYTPTEIVDFILRAADTASRDAFGRGLSDEGVHILDPFTGTGTFLTRLLQSGLITAADLARKYANELHANEIMLLAYYIAAVNIETTYHALTDASAYTPFEGIVLADTFQITEDGDTMDTVMFPQNNDRLVKQMAVPINVVIGNPPYSVGQTSANDNNANIKYPTLDGRIEKTYAKRSTGGRKAQLYDSYVRAFRWATDRIGDNGIVAFVSNGGWIDGNTADGIRLSLADEYARIYIYNLRGNQRTAGELSRKEGGKVFGSGSRNTVAIFVGVRDAAHTGPCEVLYRDIGDYLSREDKLAIVADGSLSSVEWQSITPNEHGDWVNQRGDEFLTWPAVGNKSGGARVFESYSLGLGTNRDTWCYNYSRPAIESNVRRTIDFYNSQVDGYADYCRQRQITDRKAHVDDFIEVDSTKFSWDRVNKRQIAQGTRITFNESGLRVGSYRPFTRQRVYFDNKQQLNNCTYQLPSMFPTPRHTNVGIVLTGPASHFEFTPFITDQLPNMHVLDTAQFFPRWTYQKFEPESGTLDFEDGSDVDEYGYRRVDNITDDIHKLYCEAIGAVSKDDIFYYVYGLLHDPAYREKYAADLKKVLPHIPTPQSRVRFDQLAAAGGQLAHLHVNYEEAQPYPLDVQVNGDLDDRETWRVSKMRWKTKGDFTTIVYNPRITITGIPAEAERYQLGSRSALAWIIDRYQVKTDKASGIVNDPNHWCDEHDNPRYIVEHIERVTTVAVETMKIVDTLAI